MAPQQPASLQGRLHHLQFFSPDPYALAVFYSRCLGMTVTALGGPRCGGCQDQRNAVHLLERGDIVRQVVDVLLVEQAGKHFRHRQLGCFQGRDYALPRNPM